MTLSKRITEKLAEIEVYRASLPPEEREALESAELLEQRASWVRAMAPCEHGERDFEQCMGCRGDTQ